MSKQQERINTHLEGMEMKLTYLLKNQGAYHGVRRRMYRSILVVELKH